MDTATRRRYTDDPSEKRELSRQRLDLFQDGKEKTTFQQKEFGGGRASQPEPALSMRLWKEIQALLRLETRGDWATLQENSDVDRRDYSSSLAGIRGSPGGGAGKQFP